MRIDRLIKYRLVTMAICIAAMVLGSGSVWAHCDKENGPVAEAAREALRTGEFSLIQIWVGEPQEEELRARFDDCVAVREQGGRARELADRYFVETAIRLHRTAEDMPFTGVKAAGPVAPDIAAAERALESGQMADVTEVLTEALNHEMRVWFEKAREARQDREQSVEAGREWVDAYVKYVVFVHGLYGVIQSGPEHGVAD